MTKNYIFKPHRRNVPNIIPILSTQISDYAEIGVNYISIIWV